MQFPVVGGHVVPVGAAQTPASLPAPELDPASPEVPDAPLVPDVPELPEVPEVPDAPEVPGVPLAPDVPVPEVPDELGVVGCVSVEALPGVGALVEEQ